MKLIPYAVTAEGIAAIGINFMDAMRVHLRGIPRLDTKDPAEMARRTLRANAHGVLYAGTGHFWFMWVSDFGKALRGALKTLEPAYLRRLIAYMARESDRQGRVTSCFTSRRGFDMPYYRGDNLPWLAHSVAEYARATGDKSLIEETRPALQRLLDSFEGTHFRGGLIRPDITGDWMDTILRPSSTYNNLCALHLLNLAPELGLTRRTDPRGFEQRLINERWKGDHFTDYAATKAFGVDAGALALYLELFDARLRERILAGLEKGGFAEPIPMRVSAGEYDRALMPLFTRLTPLYHSSVWLHLGLMYLNGAKRAGRDVSKGRAAVEEIFTRYGHIVECVLPDGRLYSTFVHATDYGLSMAAGQYLELVG
ncbi:MAG: hypothetical protein NTX64_18630 [Elusimicrobia bacterium]|nr:hypothetical protein [Elusimicrobiota bacterium]